MTKPPRRSAASKPAAPKQGPHERSDVQATKQTAKRASAAPTSGKVKPKINATTREPGGAAASEGRGRTAGLNGKQAQFVAEYLKDKSAKLAYMRVYGVNDATAETAGPRLFRNVQVREAIEAATAEVVAAVQLETGITLERTLREIARLGYFDPRRMFDASGRPLALHELDDDTAAAIAGLEVSEIRDDEGNVRGEIKKWKLADKRGALDMLMKHLGGFKVDNDQKTPDLAAQLAAFVGELHQSGAGRIPLAAPRGLAK